MAILKKFQKDFVYFIPVVLVFNAYLKMFGKLPATLAHPVKSSKNGHLTKFTPDSALSSPLLVLVGGRVVVGRIRGGRVFIRAISSPAIALSQNRFYCQANRVE